MPASSAAGSSLRRLIEGAPQRRRDRLLPRRGPRSRRPSSTGSWPSTASASTPTPRAYLLEHLGADRGITRSELAKLALYLGDRRGAAGAARRVTLATSPRGGRRQRRARPRRSGPRRGARRHGGQVERCLDRLLGEGESPVRLLRALANHFARLHRLAALVERGEPVEQVIERRPAADPFPPQGERPGGAAPLAGGARGARARAACSRPRSAARPPAGRRARSAGARCSRSARGRAAARRLDLTAPPQSRSCIAGARRYALRHGCRGDRRRAGRTPRRVGQRIGEGAACCATWCTAC